MTGAPQLLSRVYFQTLTASMLACVKQRLSHVVHPARAMAYCQFFRR
jgi:hypothetical protein